jgi:sugar lactone lactonase YvrE
MVIMTDLLTAQRLDAPRAEHGEGPVWTPDDGILRWVDMLQGDLLSWDPVSGASTRDHLGDVLAALRPRASGGFVVALERGFGVWHDGTLTMFREVWTDTSVRMNDGSCDTQGRFYCGSMAYDSAPGRGSLYRLDPDSSIVTVVDSVTISNGLAFSPDGTFALYVDSATGSVDQVDLTSEEASWDTRQAFVQISPDLGVPDGICLDSQGGVWVALWAGGAVHRYARSGELTHRVEVGASHPTACVLGGPDLTDLFITTSTLQSTRAADPDGGALFHVTVTHPGLPPLTFGA